MLRPALSALVLCSLAGTTLKTDYSPERKRKVESELSFSMETTEMTRERDGEPIEGRGGFGGGGIKQTRHAVIVDHVLASADGKPTKITRSFEQLEQVAKVPSRDGEREIESDTPLEGVTLELSVDKDGKTEVKVADGDAPSDSELLEGHLPTLQLDALLPGEAVEADATWELDKDQIRRALGIDLQAKLYVRKAPEAQGDQGGGPGGRRGGTGGGGGRSGQLFEMAEWEGKATLKADEEHEGVACAVIELEIEASGDLPAPAPRAGGGRGGDMLPVAERNTLASTYEIKLTGKLYFAKDKKIPMALELGGSARTEVNMEFTMDESEMRIHTVQEGEVKLSIKVSEPTE